MHPAAFRFAASMLLVVLVASCGDDGGGPSGTESERELTERWWNWAASQPEETSPILDTDGSHCALDQPDDVFFLALSFEEEVTRSCEVPAGTELFAPVIAEVCSPDTICDLGDADAAATLDGESLDVVRIENEELAITGAPDNPVTFVSEEVEVVGDGHWTRFGPLEPGEHTVELSGSDDESGFSVDVTYTLVVG